MWRFLLPVRHRSMLGFPERETAKRPALIAYKGLGDDGCMLVAKIGLSDDPASDASGFDLAADASKVGLSGDRAEHKVIRLIGFASEVDTTLHRRMCGLNHLLGGGQISPHQDVDVAGWDLLVSHERLIEGRTSRVNPRHQTTTPSTRLGDGVILANQARRVWESNPL